VVRGAPDYGIYQRPAIAEQAVWHDDFELPVLRWTPLAVAPGVAAVLSTTTHFSGNQSVFLDAPAGAMSDSLISRRFPLTQLGRIGIEFFVQGFTKTTGSFIVTLTFYDGTIPSQAQLIYDTDAGTISIVHLVAGVATTTIIARLVYMVTQEFYFLPIKLVIDTVTDMYVKLWVGGVPYDLSTYTMTVLAGSPDRYIYVQFRIDGSAADDMWMYIDDFTLSQNEP